MIGSTQQNEPENNQFVLPIIYVTEKEEPNVTFWSCFQKSIFGRLISERRVCARARHKSVHLAFIDCFTSLRTSFPCYLSMRNNMGGCFIISPEVSLERLTSN